MQLDNNLSNGNPEGSNDYHYDSGSFLTWQVWAGGCILVSIFFGSQIIYSFISVENITNPSVSIILANFLSFHITGLVAILVIVRLRIPSGERLKELCLNKNYSLSMILHALKVTLFLVPLITVLNIGILTIMKKMNWPISEDPLMDWFLTAPPLTVGLLIIGAVVIAPVAEEFMFRLVLYKVIQQFFGNSIAYVSTSLIFAVSHFKPEQILPLFILALILQRSLTQSKNILLSITIHSFFNGFMVILLLIGRYFPKSIV